MLKVTQNTRSKAPTLTKVLAGAATMAVLAAGLSACGSGNNNGDTTPATTAATDTFLSEVSKVAASAPDDTEPGTIDATAATLPDDTEPMPVI